MRQYLRNGILCILIASYAFIAAVGPFEILRHVLNSGAHLHQLAIEFPEDRSFVSIEAGRPSIPAVNLSQLPSKPRDPPSA